MEQVKVIKHQKMMQLILFIVMMGFIFICSVNGTRFFTSLIQPALDTIYMSFVAMILSAMLAFFLSFLAAYNVTPHPLLQYAVRGLASFLQSIPALVCVLVFVAAYGLGSIAGTIALVL